MKKITIKSLMLFLKLSNDAINWNGYPLVDVSPEERGNLTDLKKLGLVETFTEGGCNWCKFTALGITFARENGYDLSIYYG